MRLITLGLKLYELGSSALGFLKFRKIPQLNGIDMYGELSVPFIFTGDFKVNVEAAIIGATARATLQPLTGSSETGTWFGYAANGNVRVLMDGLSYAGAATGVNPEDGKMHLWEVERVGLTISLAIDGIFQGSFTGGGNPVTFSGAGATQFVTAGYFWPGHMTFIEFIDNSGAEPVSTKYTLDSGSDKYELPDGKPIELGVETLDDPEFLVDVAEAGTSSDFQLAAGWEVSGGALRCIAFAGMTNFFLQPLEVGSYYLMEYEVTGQALAAGKIGGVSFGGADLSVGEHSSIIQVVDQTSNLISVPLGVVEYLRIRKISNALVYNNFSTDSIDWPSYSFKDGLWIWRGSLVSGSGLFQWTCSDTTPLTISTTIATSARQNNWEGLSVDTTSAHTYSAQPEGQVITFSIANPENLFITVLENGNLFGDVPDLSSLTSLSILSMLGNRLSGYVGTSIPAVVSSIALQDNELTLRSVDTLLKHVAESVALSPRSVGVQLQGGLNATPTGGDANPDIIAIRAAGGTVTFNP